MGKSGRFHQAAGISSLAICQEGIMESRHHRTELTRDELYAQVWAVPISKLARRYGLSDRGLVKICDRDYLVDSLFRISGTVP